MLFSGTSAGALTCDCSSSSSHEMLSRTDAASWWVVFFLDTQRDGYLWPCRWHFLSLTVPSRFSFENMSIGYLYLSSCKSTPDQMCKRISRVSWFIDCHSLEKMIHKNEKTLSDSALDKGAVRQISRTCNKLWIPKSCPLQKIINWPVSFWGWLWNISHYVIMENFKLFLQVVNTAIISKYSKDLKCSTMTFTLSWIISTLRKAYDSDSWQEVSDK